jgi:hypothetical protein
MTNLSRLEADAAGFCRWFRHGLRMASTTTTNWASYFSSKSVRVSLAFCSKRSFLEGDTRPHDANVDLNSSLLRNTLDNIATPCSVKA